MNRAAKVDPRSAGSGSCDRLKLSLKPAPMPPRVRLLRCPRAGPPVPAARDTRPVPARVSERTTPAKAVARRSGTRILSRLEVRWIAESTSLAPATISELLTCTREDAYFP
jgi:hypothetical protein